MKTPIAFFTYNRPTHAQFALEALAACARLDECKLYVFCDGAKAPEDAARVEECRAVVSAHANRLGAEVIARDQNYGLAKSIKTGITNLCREYGRVIAIEDDLAVSPVFLDYMLRALDRYENAPGVYQIAGYMFPVAHPAQPEAFFLPMATTWGWATWQRVWETIDWNATGAFDELKDRRVRRAFDLDDSYPYAAMLEDRLANKNDSWGILFWWSLFKARGLTLHPSRSLVWNGGFDAEGTHCKEYPWSNEQSKDHVIEGKGEQLLRLPERVVSDEAAFKRVKSFLRQQKYPTTLVGRAWRRAKSSLQKTLYANANAGLGTDRGK